MFSFCRQTKNKMARVFSTPFRKEMKEREMMNQYGGVVLYSAIDPITGRDLLCFSRNIDEDYDKDDFFLCIPAYLEEIAKREEKKKSLKRRSIVVQVGYCLTRQQH